MEHSAASGHARPDVTLYMIIFGALFILTIATVMVSYLHLPPVPAIAAAIGIATIKAALVATFFMHLKNERVIIYGLLGVTAFFVLFLYAMPIIDSVAVSAFRPAQSVFAAEDFSVWPPAAPAPSGKDAGSDDSGAGR